MNSSIDFPCCLRRQKEHVGILWGLKILFLLLVYCNRGSCQSSAPEPVENCDEENRSMAEPLFIPQTLDDGTYFVSKPPAPFWHFSTDSRPESAESLQQTSLKQIPANLGKDFLGLFARDNILPLLIGSAATGLSATQDDPVHQYFAERDTDRPLGNIGDTLGKPIVLVPAIGSILAFGTFSSNQRFHSFSYALTEGFLLDSALTTGLKYAVGRERPDSTNMLSFPSGHASDYFMIATTVDQYYGHIPGALMYGLAGYVGFSRLVKDKHWLSDVVGGATLGYIVGRTVSHRTGDTAQQKRFRVIPFGSLKQKEFGVRFAIRLGH